jgi:AcrR family transcriptional regulator
MPASTKRPLRRDAERNRQRILAAAAEVFAQRGLAATLDDVAREAGVGVGTVYRRFADKEELIDALFEQRIDEMVARAEASLADDDPWTALVRFFEGFVEAQCDDRGLMELLVSRRHGQARVTRARDRFIPLVEALVERAQAAGALRPDVVARDVPLIHVMLASVVDYTRDIRPEVSRRYLALMLDGLRADGRPRTELPGPALEIEEVTAAMSAWKARPR